MKTNEKILNRSLPDLATRGNTAVISRGIEINLVPYKTGVCFKQHFILFSTLNALSAMGILCRCGHT